MLSMDTASLKTDLISLIDLLQNLNPAHLTTICRFVQRSPEDLMLPEVREVLKEATNEQVDKLITMTVKRPPFPHLLDEQSSPETDALNKLPQELIEGFSIVLQLYQLQNLLNGMSTLQLMKMFEVIPPVPQVQQLQLLEQLQQLLGQLLPRALKNLQEELKSGNVEAEQQMLSQLLQWDRGHLYQPLRLLLQLGVEDLLTLQELFPKLQPVQMRQLLTLLQLLPYDVLELKRLFEKSRPESSPQPTNIPQQQSRLTLKIVEQPPEKSVYKRNLKPNPMIQVVGDDSNMESNLHVAPVLIRCDTLEEKPKLMTGNKALKAAPGRVVVFRRLKITSTSHQQGESLFAIKFELRRYQGNEYEVLDYVQSNPICVLSHSTQLKPASSTTATITEVIPYCGSSLGGTRVAVLGNNFVDTPSARVRFDDTDVIPKFHGPRTLICSTPKHKPGIVSVRVSNDSKVWSPTAASFQYEDREEQSPVGIATQMSQELDLGIDVGSSICEVAWQGNIDELKSSIGGKNSGVVDVLDGNNYSSLHYASALGHVKIVEFLLECQANVNIRDGRGNSPLYWACYFSRLDIVELLVDHGAKVNLCNTEGITGLHIAAWNGDRELVDYLLENGANPNCANVAGETALHCAVSNADNKLGSIEVLLECGAFVNAQNLAGDTALHYAVVYDRIDAIRLLVNAGCIGILGNSDGETPLHYAVACGTVDMVQELLKWKAGNGNITDHEGQSALGVVMLEGKSDLMSYLLADSSAQADGKDDNRHSEPGKGLGDSLKLELPFPATALPPLSIAFEQLRLDVPFTRTATSSVS